MSLGSLPITSALLFKLGNLIQQYLKHLAVGGLQYYYFTRKKIIYQKACAAPKVEYSELAKVGVFVTAEGTPSKPPSTLYQCLKRQGLSNVCCKKRPKLNRTHALKRLQFCRQYRHFE
jgi:hypothetical protein